jgi:hypothetical protein
MNGPHYRRLVRRSMNQYWMWILILTLSSFRSSLLSTEVHTFVVVDATDIDVSTATLGRVVGSIRAEEQQPHYHHHRPSKISSSHPYQEEPNGSTGLPSPLQWRNRPIYIQADAEGTSTRIVLNNNNEDEDDDDLVRTMVQQDGSLPLGVPIPFESDIFKGRILFRIRNVDKPCEDNEAYFGNPGKDIDTKSHKSNNRLWQFIVQGRFKTPIAMDDLYTGEVYDKPLVNLPSPIIMRQVGRLFNMVVPGVQFDIASTDRPKVLTLYGGTVQTMRKDIPGTEPNIRLFDIEEDTSRIQQQQLLQESTGCSTVPNYSNYRRGDVGHNNNCTSNTIAFANTIVRKKDLSNPKVASQYVYDTDHVYTWDHHDNKLDYGTYMANILPGIKVDMIDTLNGQPMTIGAVTGDGRWMFRFKVYHERQILQQQQQ